MSLYPQIDPQDQDAIFDSERAVRAARSDYEVAKNVAAERKKALDKLVASHFKLLADLRDPQRELPFAAAEQRAAATPADDGPRPAPPTPPAGDETWRKAGLSALQLPEKIQDALEDAGIFTLGHLSDWTKNGKRLLTDIRGIAEARAEIILDALTKFWERRATPDPEPAPEVPAKPEPGSARAGGELSFDPPREWTPEADRDEEDD